MTADELMRDFAGLGPQSLDVFLEYVIKHWYELEIRGATGDRSKVRDSMDAKIMLEQLSAAARGPRDPRIAFPKLSLNLAQQPGECPICHHVHSAGSYCGEYLGELQFCQCEERANP